MQFNAMRRNIFLWALYDFANSFVYIAFLLYFSQWIVADQNISDLWFNLSFAIASILLLLTAPFVGVKLDEKWKNISCLKITTLAIVFFYSLTAFFAIKDSAATALVFFTVGQFFFALSFAFYTPLINAISTSNNRGVVSGLGLVGNFTGNIAGLLLAAPFASGKINLFGGLDRAETIAPAIMAFIIFSLPLLLFFKEPRVKEKEVSMTKNYLHKAISIFQNRNILIFLVAFALFNGAILTFISNAPIILERVWGIADNAKTYAVMAVIMASAVGSFIFGRLADRFGKKITLIYILTGWIILLLLIAIMLNLYYFILWIITGGLLIGGVMAVSRALMADLTTDKDRNLGFSYFNVIERTSIIIGPIIWGAIVSGLASFGAVRYQIALMAMAALIFTGLIFLIRLKKAE